MGSLCRICLKYFTDNDFTIDVSNCSAFSDPNRKSLVLRIFTNLSIKVFDEDDNEENKVICTDCDQQINGLVAFIEMCLDSDVAYKEMMIKKEIITDNLWSENSTDHNDILNAFFSEEEIKECVIPSDEKPLANLQNDSPKKYVCQHCPKTFKGFACLLNHSFKHAEVGVLSQQCELCLRRFSNQRQLFKHVCKAQKEGKNNYADDSLEKTIHCCPVCREQFTDLKVLNKHLKSHKEHCCLECEDKFSSKQLLMQHKKERHCQKFSCFCGKSYNRKSKLNSHKAIVHEHQDLRSFQCDLCDKKFRGQCDLKYHKNTHLGLKPFKCTKCSSAFAFPNYLTNHERRHKPITDSCMPAKRYLCDNCAQAFTRKSHLQRHILRKHTANAPRNFACHLCGRAFFEKDTLNFHIKCHTAPRTCTCKDCGKSFLTSWRLQHHINRVHLELRPFPCTTCGHQFKVKAHLQKHMRTHTGEKPFPCPKCPYLCAEKSNLAKHMKIHNRCR